MLSIHAENLTKEFYLQQQKTLKELLQALVFRESAMEKVKALDTISFSVAKGESVGILGRNGAGKSTLLKLIARISKPSEGTLTINGSIAPLIELGAGFHPELTGRDNTYLNGIILGMTKDEVTERIPEIIEFAGIHEYFDVPIKFYSSGMYVRLAFSIATASQPEILIVDEVLSVGDFAFQEKCQKRMQQFKENGVTIVLVTHDSNLVSHFCDRALVLDQGKLVFDGDSSEAVSFYQPES